MNDHFLSRLQGQDIEAVTFVADYIQIQFLDYILTVLCDIQIDNPAVGRYANGSGLWRDALCGCIDTQVISISFPSPSRVDLLLSSRKEISFQIGRGTVPDGFSLELHARRGSFMDEM